MDEVWRSTVGVSTELMDPWWEQLAVAAEKYGHVELAQRQRTAWQDFKEAIRVREAMICASKDEAEQAMAELEEVRRAFEEAIGESMEFVSRKEQAP
jgi:hypothetical protein